MQLKFKEFFYISNLLSISRIFLTLPIIYLIKINTETGNLILMPLTLLTAATDYFDGYFSRRMNQVTDLGKILDPLADKIGLAFILTALILFRDFPIPLVVFLVYRDILIIIVGWIALRNSGQPVAANFWGKLNTTVISIAGLLFIFNFSGILITIALVVSYVTILISGYFYGLIGERLLFTKKNYRYTFRFSLFIVTALIAYWMYGFSFI